MNVSVLLIKVTLKGFIIGCRKFAFGYILVIGSSRNIFFRPVWTLPWWNEAMYVMLITLDEQI